MINVSKPFLPDFDEYVNYLKGIWERNWLTNNGPLVNELELKLKEYLDIKHLLFINNGTVALQIAIKALDLKGEVITTPFSFIATTSSLIWENCTPVFADIDAKTMNIDPAKIEAAITDKTTGILATHVYGNACDIDAIEAISKKHDLKVIYDAAHCFGTKYKGRSVFEYGDISITSFHATKLFHTIEGGAVFTKDAELLKKMAFMRNFGFNGPENFANIGINGKNSEFHAAMGLANIKHLDAIFDNRKKLVQYYDEKLAGLNITKPVVTDSCECNHSYYPIMFNTEEELKKNIAYLNSNWVYPRRYFYPSLNIISTLHGAVSMPISEDVSKRVMCLPLYHDLSKEEIDLICRMLLRIQNNSII